MKDEPATCEECGHCLEDCTAEKGKWINCDCTLGESFVQAYVTAKAVSEAALGDG